MSGGMREIKRRIKSVGSTRQITKAMNLVASSKLNKARERFTSINPYTTLIKEVIGELGSEGGFNHPLITGRSQVKNTTIIVLAGDRGLCGGYNSGVCQLALEQGKDKSCDYLTIGAKAGDYLKSRGKTIIKSVKGISENPDYEEAKIIGEMILDHFNKGETDEVYLVYTKYNSTISYESICTKLLPLSVEDFDRGEPKGVTLYEPSPTGVMGYVLPKYVNTVIYGAMAEAALCEQSARMTAMDSATENADEMLDTLNTKYNRARQGAITQEITEIISGAEA